MPARDHFKRRRLGKVWPFEVKALWAQSVVRSGRAQQWNIEGADNTADLETKPLSWEHRRRLCRSAGVFTEVKER